MLKLNSTIIKQIMLQRTSYAVEGETEPDAERIAIAYHDGLVADYGQIRPFLPVIRDRAEILDVGCGIGGISLFLYRHYEGNVNLHLLDKDGFTPQLYYGFQEVAAHYNMLSSTVEFLEMNGVDCARVATHSVREDDGATDFFPGRSFDVVISFFSWGFHYPVSIYLDYVRKTLKKEGALIIDIRDQTGGVKELEECFDVRPIFKGRKHERFVCKVR